MTSYAKFGAFYDPVMGDRTNSVKEIKALLKKYNSKASDVLELACGTGAILKGLKKDYNIEGLDLSYEMLRVAHSKLSGVKLHHTNMTSFKLKKQFDAII